MVDLVLSKPYNQSEQSLAVYPVIIQPLNGVFDCELLDSVTLASIRCLLYNILRFLTMDVINRFVRINEADLFNSLTKRSL